MVAYSLIHHKNKFEKELIKVSKWSNERVENYINKRTFSLDSKKPSKITRKNREFQNNVVAANIVNNNYPDINKIVAEDIEGTDLLTYSFPCQGLSIANMGRAKGIKEDSDSTSNLIWQIKRILDDAIDKGKETPKYLLMENVKALIGKNHKEDYLNWKEYLHSIGYNTYTIILNGLKHRSIQKRERVIGLSIKKEFDNTLFKYKPKEIISQEFKDYMDNNYSQELSLKAREKEYLSILSNPTEEEITMSVPNNTISRKRMAKENIDLIKQAKNRKHVFNTLTTKQDRHPNIGMINLQEHQKVKGKLHKRFITPREAYKIQGFKDKDFNNVFSKYKEGIITKGALYRQAGNSIVVTVLEDIFKFIDELERRKNG